MTSNFSTYIFFFVLVLVSSNVFVSFILPFITFLLLFYPWNSSRTHLVLPFLLLCLLPPPFHLQMRRRRKKTPVLLNPNISNLFLLFLHLVPNGRYCLVSPCILKEKGSFNFCELILCPPVWPLLILLFPAFNLPSVAGESQFGFSADQFPLF